METEHSTRPADCEARVCAVRAVCIRTCVSDIDLPLLAPFALLLLGGGGFRPSRQSLQRQGPRLVVGPPVEEKEPEEEEEEEEEEE